MTTPATPPVQAGEVIAGKYRVERVLGQGGMGVVVAATHLELGDRVALKFLLPAAIQSPEVVARFLREAQAAVRIKSEHVARVSDLGKLPTGAPYIVMEYLEGEDLAALLKRTGPLPPLNAVGYVLQACEALAEAHQAGIVHRDLKPANLFLVRRADGSPCVKVLDFGISKGAHGVEEAQLTGTTAAMGSPLYMSPEQMKSSRNVDARADIWSLGVLLQQLLTGRVPFEAQTMPQLCSMVLTEPPTTLRQLAPGAPVALEALLLRCLEKDPARRFQNVAELARALEPFGPPEAQISSRRISRIFGDSSAPLSAPLSAPAFSPAPAAPPSVPTALSPAPPPAPPGAVTLAGAAASPHSLALGLGALGLGLGLAAILAFSAWASHRASRAPAPAPTEARTDPSAPQAAPPLTPPTAPRSIRPKGR